MKVEKMISAETILRKGIGRIKENDGGSEFNVRNIVGTLVIVTRYAQYKNNMIINFFFKF
jgi:hypothetical protein